MTWVEEDGHSKRHWSLKHMGLFSMSGICYGLVGALSKCLDSPVVRDVGSFCGLEH